MIFNQSGGTSLNFKVVKNPQPVNPSPNTIWLDTDHKINGYSFFATQPENMAEGEVWFCVGTSSTVAFSATKKNPVMVYPLSAKQKIDGALVDVTAKSYQNGEWVDWWRGELYKDGKLYNVLADGFETAGSTVVEYKDSYFIYYNPSENGVIASPEKVDTTGYTTISIIGGLNYTSSASQNFKAGLATAKNASSFVSSVYIPNGATGKELSITIPPDGGEYYLVFTCGGSTGVSNCPVIEEIIMK
jgi:hypothetical protein